MSLQNFNRIAIALVCSMFAFQAFSQQTAQTAGGIANNDFTNSSIFAAWGDYDNDGDLDLVRIGYTQPRVNRNDGNNVFNGTGGIINLSTTGDGYQAGVWADMDNDGLLDLAYVTYGNGFTPICKNNGDGTFTIKKQFGRLQYGNLDVADIDLDGDMDLIACGDNWAQSGTDHGVKIFRNDGGWIFTEVYTGQIANVRGGGTSVASNVRFADFTNDGLPDILVAGSTAGSRTNGSCVTAVYRNTGSGFALMYSGVGVYNGKVDIGDYNSDGWVDFAATGELDGSWGATGNVYMNNGDGSFTNFSVSSRSNGSIAFGDYDNDGDLDLCIQGSPGGNQVYRNDGSNVFTTTTEITTGSTLSGGTSAWGDYTGDGRLDIFSVGNASGNPTSLLLKNTSTVQVNTAPAAPTGMVSNMTAPDVTLSWDAATDGQTASAGLSYNVMVGTSPGGINIVAPNSDPATGYRRVPKIGNCWSNKFFTLKLPPGIYYWKVQAIDNAFAGSAFANGGNFVIPPPAPTVSTPINYCVGDAASVLTATGMGGASFVWYTVSTGGTPLAGAPTPLTTSGAVGTTNFWVSQKVNGIEGGRSLIAVNVYAIPAAPTVANLAYCNGDVAVPLTATPTGTATLNWWGTAATGGTASGTAPTPSTSVFGTTTYYVSQTLNGCESSRAAIVVTVYAIPSGPTVTTPVVYCQYASATQLTATPSAGGTLFWYGTLAIGGTAGIAPTPSTSTTGSTVYYVTQKVNGCESTPRTPISVNVNSAPNIITSPSAATICSGANTSFTVFATGAGLTYQWQFSSDGGTNYVNLSNTGVYSNVTTTTMNITGTPVGANGYYYRCIVNGTCTPSATTSGAMLTVNSLPSFSAFPSNATICSGNTASFSVTASGTGITYQWKVSTNGGVSYSNVTNGSVYSNATTTTLTLTGATTSFNGYYYQCVVSGTCTPSVTSLAGILTVNSLPAIGTQPSSATLCAGSNASFAVAATGTALTYQWQFSTDGGTSYVNLSNSGVYSNVTNASMNITGTPVGANGYYYRCIVSGTCTPSVTSTGGMLTVNSLPAVSTHPSNSTICSGNNTTFTAAASGTSITYQWQYSADAGNNYFNVTNGGIYSNATTATLTLTGANTTYANYYYRCNVSGTCAPAVNTNAAILTVNGLPTIGTPPSAAATCSGSNASFSIAATGAGLTYQWQESTNGGSTYANITNGGIYSNATAAALSLTGVATAATGYFYRCIVNGTCTPSVTSTGGMLTVNSLPSINTQPASSTICSGSNTSFAVAATGTGITYQWQLSTDGGTNYTNITNGGIYSNAASATLNLTGVTTAANGYYYKCIISGTCTPSVTSSGVMLTVNSLPSINTQPSVSTICSGGNASFTVGAAGTALTYQWQESTNGGSSYSNITNGGIYSNATTSTLSLTSAIASGYYYRCIVSGTCAPSVTSGGVMLTVNSLPFINTQPSASSICLGNNASFTVAASGAGLVYQWQESTDGGSVYSNITNGGIYSNSTTATLSISGATLSATGYYYRCVLSGTCTPSVTSTGVMLTVNASPTIGTQPSASTICSGGNASFTVAATGAGLTYQWQESTNGGSNYNNITNTGIYSNATTATLSLTGATTTGNSYRCIVGGTCAPSVTSNGVTLTVGSLPMISVHPSPQTKCEGSSANFTITASGVLIYQWQVSLDGGVNYTDLADGGSYYNTASSSLIVVPAPSSLNGYYYRCVVSGGCPPAAVSNGAMLTINSLPAISSPPQSSIICSGANTTFSVTASGAGISYQWKESTNSGSTFNNISDGGIYSNATTAILNITGATTPMNNYFYRCIVSGTCTPAVTSASAKLTVNALPSVTSSVSGSGCSGIAQNYLITGSLAGTTFNWSRASVVGISNGSVSNQTSSIITESLTNTTGGPVSVIYIITPAANGCTGTSVNYTATINTIPAAPSVTNASFCMGATATALIATPGGGGTLNWYGTNSTGGIASPLAPVPSTAAVGIINYYVSQTISGCESSRSSLAVTIIANPSAPSVTNPGSYCVGVTASSLIATPSIGGTLNWYGTNSTGGTASSTATIPSTVSANTTAYYVSQSVNGCESSRSSMNVIVNSIPPLPAVESARTYCINISSTALLASPMAGGTLNWYGINSTGGTASASAPVPSTATAGTINYYVSQTVNGCESNRAPIAVNVLSSIPVPTVTSPVTYCQQAVASPLNATSNGTATLQWYGTSSSGGIASETAPMPQTSVAGTTTYYVSQKENGCESYRSSISVTINPLPAVDAGPDRTITEGTSLTLNGIGDASSYTWNNSVTNGVAFTPVVEASGYYVVSGILGSCAKKDSMVLIVLRPNLPEIGVLYQNQQFFSGSEVNIGNATVTQGPFRYTFRITNQGYINLNVSDVIISGINASSFFADKANMKAIVKPDSSTTFDLVFQPIDTGNVVAKITILNDDQDESNYDINISGYSTRIVPTLVFASIGDKEYGSPAFSLIATASNAKPVTFTTTTPTLVTIAGDVLTPDNLGDVLVQASIPGDTIYEPVTMQQTFKIQLPVFGLLGPDYLAENIGNAYQVYPYRPQFDYKWNYQGTALNFTAGDTTHQVTVFAAGTTTNGNIVCKIYNQAGDLLGAVQKPLIINHVSSNAPALKTVNCAPAIGDVSNCYIKDFELEGISSASTYNNSGITDFTQAPISADLFLGETYSAVIKVHGTLNAERAIAVWIDFNNNSVFSQDEYLVGDLQTDTIINLNNIRIPNAEAYIGYRRLRIRVREASAFTNSQSCVEEGEKGETEDYLVNLKSRLDVKGSEFMSPNGDGKNDCFTIRGVNPRSLVRTLQVFDVMGDVVYSDDFYENDWCGIAMEGNGKGKLVPKGVYYYIFETEESVIKSFIEVTY